MPADARVPEWQAIPAVTLCAAFGNRSSRRGTEDASNAWKPSVALKARGRTKVRSLDAFGDRRLNICRLYLDHPRLHEPRPSSGLANARRERSGASRDQEHRSLRMTTRRLAAILAADVVGFSSMMERNEEGTLARLKALQCDLFEPRVSAHHGRLVKTTGDGFLVEFASPLEAVRCALGVQDHPGRHYHPGRRGYLRGGGKCCHQA
jgi:class 3 adenylate cyclase